MAVARRYQPVWRRIGDIKVFGVCKIVVDDKGALVEWESMHNAPIGTHSVGALETTLIAMLLHAGRWKPVEFSSLASGMTFETTDTGPDEMLSAVFNAMAEMSKRGAWL